MDAGSPAFGMFGPERMSTVSSHAAVFEVFVHFARRAFERRAELWGGADVPG